LAAAIVRTNWRICELTGGRPGLFSCDNPTPIPFEPIALPGNHRVGPNDYQRRLPILPDHPQRNPKQSVSTAQFGTLHIAPEYGQLLAKRRVF
jgi:hypothetical protein